MAQSANPPPAKLLDKFTNLHPVKFDLHNGDLSHKCFYCGLNFNDNPETVVEADEMRVKEPQGYDYKEDVVRIYVGHGKAFGCNVRFMLVFPKQMWHSVRRTNLTVAWMDWWEAEQKWCEGRGLVPSWLLTFYEAEREAKEAELKAKKDDPKEAWVEL